MWDFIYRHFQSEGFQRRLRNWYLPAAKVVLAWAYKRAHAALERYTYEKEYKANRAIEPDMPSASPMPIAPTAAAVLSYDQAVEIMRKYLINHDPQYFGTCVANTMKNAVRFASKIAFGKDFDLSEGDVYIDRETLAMGLDQGMYPDSTIPRVAEKGIAIRGMVPTATTLDELTRTTRKEYPDASLAPYRIKILTGGSIISAPADFEALWGYITTTYAKSGIRPFQATIWSYSGWWGSDVPQATGQVLGSHSIVGVALPFMYGTKRAFFVIDSAFLTAGVWLVGKGVRIVTEDVWRVLGHQTRKLAFCEAVEAKLTQNTTPTLSVSGTAKRGDSGATVESIQRAMIALGYDIPSVSSGQSAYGYYGQQTANAVKAWQVASWRNFYALDSQWTEASLAALAGNSFGTLSVQVVNKLLASV